MNSPFKIRLLQWFYGKCTLQILRRSEFGTCLSQPRLSFQKKLYEKTKINQNWIGESLKYENSKFILVSTLLTMTIRLKFGNYLVTTSKTLSGKLSFIWCSRSVGSSNPWFGHAEQIQEFAQAPRLRKYPVEHKFCKSMIIANIHFGACQRLKSNSDPWIRINVYCKKQRNLFYYLLMIGMHQDVQMFITAIFYPLGPQTTHIFVKSKNWRVLVPANRSTNFSSKWRFRNIWMPQKIFSEDFLKFRTTIIFIVITIIIIIISANNNKLF